MNPTEIKHNKRCFRLTDLSLKSKKRSAFSIDLCDADDSISNKQSKYDFPMTDDHVEVYTDGACENNGRANAKAGIGVWFADNHPL